MSKFFKLLALGLIWVYRLFVSPFTPPSCRFQPTCSEYMMDALRLHGAWAGLVLGTKRLSVCHPFAKRPLKNMRARHGYDPVPLEILPIAWYAPWRIVSATSEMDKETDKD